MVYLETSLILSVDVPLSIIIEGVPVLSFTFVNTGLLVSISESTGETEKTVLPREILTAGLEMLLPQTSHPVAFCCH